MSGSDNHVPVNIKKEGMGLDSEPLEYTSKGLTTLPRDDPNYSTATILLMKDNLLTTLNASELPRNLTYLELSDNAELTTITGTFPATLDALMLDGTNITEIPILPGNLSTLAVNDTPVGREKGIRSTIHTKREIDELTRPVNTSKYIEWTAIDYSRAIFTEEEQYQIRFLPSKEFAEEKEKFKNAILKNSSLCRSTIGKDYIETMIDNTSNIISEKIGDTVLAFCLFHINPSSIYIDVICSSQINKGGGSRIIDKIISYMKNHPEILSINLESISDSIGFYEKKRFKRCNAKKLCPMTLSRSEIEGGYRRNKRTTKVRSRRLRKTRRAQRSK